MRSLIYKLLLFFAFFTTSIPIFSRQRSNPIYSETQDQLTKLFEDWDNDNAPGFILKVIRNGEIVYENNIKFLFCVKSVKIAIISTLNINCWMKPSF